MDPDRPRSEYRREVDQAGSDGPRREPDTASTGTGFVPFSWPTLPTRSRGPEGTGRAGAESGRPGNYRNDYASERARGRERDERVESVLDRGLISLLIAVGIVLALIPEPATSAAGLLLIGAGAFAWILDRLSA